MNKGLLRHENLVSLVEQRLREWYQGKDMRSHNIFLGSSKMSLEDHVFYPKGEWDIVISNELSQPERIYEIKGRHSSTGIFRAYKQLLRGSQWCYKEYGFIPDTIYVSQNPKIDELIVKRMKFYENKVKR